MTTHREPGKPAIDIDFGGEVTIWPLDYLAECAFCGKRWPTDKVDAHEQRCIKNPKRVFKGAS